MGINNKGIEEYRNTVTRIISADTIIAEILHGNEVWKNFFPVQFRPGVKFETNAMLFYDIEEAFDKNIFNKCALYFWIMVHKEDLRFRERLRSDVLEQRLYALFNSKNNLGAFNNFYVSSEILPVPNSFTGRLVKYTFKDYTADKRCKN
jgi:hypothetical protein